MLGFRLNPPGPFWFEDLLFFVTEESRRLPYRVATAVSKLKRLARKATEFDLRGLARRHTATRPVPAPIIASPREVDRIAEPEAWALATEPLVAVGTSAQVAISLHKAAAEQLDAITYVLSQLRDELRPMMIYSQLKEDDNVRPLRTAAELETSIEALLELSRANAVTRPRDRMRSAA